MYAIVSSDDNPRRLLLLFDDEVEDWDAAEMDEVADRMRVNAVEKFILLSIYDLCFCWGLFMIIKAEDRVLDQIMRCTTILLVVCSGYGLQCKDIHSLLGKIKFLSNTNLTTKCQFRE